jgi:hypothetical protein
MPKSKSNKSDKQSSKKKVVIAVAVAAIAVIASLVVVIVVLLNREPEVEYLVQLIPGPGIGSYERNIGGRGFMVTQDNVDEIREYLAQRDPVDAGFEFSKTTNWRFPTAFSPSPNALVRNVERNSRTVFFDVYIPGIGVVYVSPYMPLGSEHRNFALDVEIDAGVYNAIVTYFLVDDDFVIITDVSVGVTIVVEN